VQAASLAHLEQAGDKRRGAMAGSSMDTEAAGHELKQGSGYSIPATAHAVDTGMNQTKHAC